MPGHVIIDGNNLLHAMHAHAPVPHVGRETMVRHLERWAKTHSDDVTLVYDGGPPRDGMLRQMSSRRIVLRFSAPLTADDVIVAMVSKVRHPDTVCVVTDDTAIKYETKLRRCRHKGTVPFIKEVFRDPAESSKDVTSATPDEKPQQQTDEDVDRWTELFGDED